MTADAPAELEAVIDEVWRRLAEGATIRRGPFHTPTLATIGADGAPQARTVVLREANRAAGVLRFHTDARAPKAADMAARPRVALHVYDAAAKVQVRLGGTARLAPFADGGETHWTASQPMSRVCYAITPGPGVPIGAPDGYDQPRDAEAVAAGARNFVAVLVDLATIDWLYLRAEGHRRAGFRLDGGAWRGTWLAP